MVTRVLQTLLNILPEPRKAAATTASAPALNELNEGIADFYDESSGIWEDMWGQHMHHGYYERTGSFSLEEHRVAQVLMIDRTIEWAYGGGGGGGGGGGRDNKGVAANMAAEGRMLDVGCGIGGSSRHIVRSLGSGWQGAGVTLSPAQAQRANELTLDAFGDNPPIEYFVQDAVQLTSEGDEYDLVWSMESAEHIEDKRAFLREMHRVLKPGGRIIVVTWCHRSTKGKELTDDERSLLKSLCDAYFLPKWCSMDRYVEICRESESANNSNGGEPGTDDDADISPLFENVRTTDWSEKVAPFWGGVIESAAQPKGLVNLFTKTGLRTIRGAFVMPLMQEGYKSGLIEFQLLTATKPQRAETTSC